MNEVDRIKSLAREADLYRKQGLFEQARTKYIEALNLIQKSEALKNQVSSIESLKKRIKSVEETIDEVEKATETPELSEDMQNLISNLFSYSRNKSLAAIEGAIALAKFGQYEKAFMEFERLIKDRVFPIMAAENMLRCQMIFISPERAVEQFKKWASTRIFTKKELISLKEFMEALSKKEGVKLVLPEISAMLHEENKKDINKEQIISISSISIRVKSGSKKDLDLDLDITFQTGNILSFIVKADKKELIDFLKTGVKIPAIQCYSPISVFPASGVITDKKQIPSGPRKGDYTFDLTLEKA